MSHELMTDEQSTKLYSIKVCFKRFEMQVCCFFIPILYLRSKLTVTASRLPFNRMVSNKSHALSERKWHIEILIELILGQFIAVNNINSDANYNTYPNPDSIWSPGII